MNYLGPGGECVWCGRWSLGEGQEVSKGEAQGPDFGRVRGDDNSAHQGMPGRGRRAAPPASTVEGGC